MPIPDDNLARLLLTAIARRGLSIGEASSLLGCASGTLQGWLKGRKPRLKHLRRIAGLCEVTIETVLAQAGRTRP